LLAVQRFLSGRFTIPLPPLSFDMRLVCNFVAAFRTVLYQLVRFTTAKKKASDEEYKQPQPTVRERASVAHSLETLVALLKDGTKR
jgi:hypothetical protein